MIENEDFKSEKDLRVIKSPYIKKTIFSFFNEKWKLKMIK